MARRFVVELAVLGTILALFPGCGGAPRASRQVNRAVLGELFVISD